MNKLLNKIFSSIKKKKKGFNIQSIDESFKLKLTNKFSLIITHLFIVILITSVKIYAFPALFFTDYLFYALIFLSLILVYLIIFQLNYHVIKIDNHFIDIKIFRTVFSTTNPKNHIYLPNEILKDFSFLNSSFKFNNTLNLKIKTDNEEIKTIKLNLLFSSKNEISRVNRFLKKIIHKNNSQK